MIRPTRLVARGGGLGGRRRRETRPPPARRRQHARVLHGVEPRWRHAGGQPAQQRQRVHVHRDRPVAVGLLQGDAHQAVRTLLHALLRHRRTQHVAQQRLPPRRVESARPRRRVQREPIERRAQRLVVGQGLRRGGFPLRREGSCRPYGVVPWAGAGNSANGGGRGSACERVRTPDARGRSELAKVLILNVQKWCRRRDSNPHGFPHTPLKRACLPIPPLRRRAGNGTIDSRDHPDSCQRISRGPSGSRGRRWRPARPVDSAAGMRARRRRDRGP